MRLVIKGLQKSFGEKEVLKNVTYEFEQGKIYGLLGRNGAGKTTLFNCLSGEVIADQKEIMLDVDGVCRRLESKDLGYVYSTPILPEFLTGYEFLKFYIEINQDKVAIDHPIEYYFQLVQMDLADGQKLIKDYSHGMKNKLQMLCVMIARPPVILLDEPLTSLDVVVALEIKRILKSIKMDHIILFSTHILQLATDLCDEIVVLNDGVLEELPHELLKSPEFEDRIIQILSEA